MNQTQADAGARRAHRNTKRLASWVGEVLWQAPAPKGVRIGGGGLTIIVIHNSTQDGTYRNPGKRHEQKVRAKKKRDRKAHVAWKKSQGWK